MYDKALRYNSYYNDILFPSRNIVHDANLNWTICG
jgi:hypothetical protein